MAAALALPACPAHRSTAAGTTGSAAADVANPALGLPQGTVTVTRSGTTELALHVQIAETDQARTTGLMGVRKMSDHAGMAFLFDGPTTESFWMKDTLIPLDIAFYDTQGRIVSTFSMVPCTAEPCQLYTPVSEYVGAVEMNGGLLAAHGVTVGDTVSLARSAANRGATRRGPRGPWPAPAPNSRRSTAPGEGARGPAPRSPRPARSRRPA